jgi:PAS domain S-box-containing protein
MKPTTLLVRTLSITVAAELAILLGFDLMRVEPGIAAAIFNAVILSALTAPLLYSFVFRAAQREVKVLGDATGFTEAQHALEQSEKRFRTLMEKIPDGLGVLSRDGRIIYANPAVSTMLGYSTAELRGKRVRELQHPEDRERAARRTQELFRDSAEYPSEFGIQITASERYCHTRRDVLSCHRV